MLFFSTFRKNYIVMYVWKTTRQIIAARGAVIAFGHMMQNVTSKVYYYNKWYLFIKSLKLKPLNYSFADRLC